MFKSFWFSGLLVVLVSVVLSAGISYQVVKRTVSETKKFKVVDVKQLSKALMVNLEKTIREQGTELKPEFIKVIAQNEAKKMFAAIARSGSKDEIIFDKSTIISSPASFDITPSIAQQMGLEGIVVRDLNSLLKLPISDSNK